MSIIIGSARHDENGKYAGGSAGDQTGTEVSTQSFYVHSKGWNVIRANSDDYANALASKMLAACNNSKIGYDQNNRLGIIKYGISTTTATECDCSSLVRQCVIEATGKDPGNFTTANALSKLVATGLFTKVGKYTSSTKLYQGDILCTCTKGHIVIVCSGANARGATTTTTSTSSSSSKVATDKAAKKNSSYSGTYKTTADLNMRNGAGTSKSIMVTLPKGTKVKCYGYYSVSGSTTWLYVQATYNNVVYTGFCSIKYLSEV